MILNDILVNNPLLIVDVGASGGIHRRWTQFTSSYKAVLFEPDPREYNILKQKSGKNLIVLNSILSDSINNINFHLCKRQEVSSVYLPNFDFLSKFPDVEMFEVIKDIRIKSSTLNAQLQKNSITEVDFIKIDTQGHELPILKGCVDYLDNIIGLELEVEFAPLYENQPLFNEVDGFVRNKGFQLFDIKRYYWKRKGSIKTGSQKGQLVFGDALYFKSPEHVLLINNITQEKIIRAICIYLIYGYLDLAQSLVINANIKGLLTKQIYNTAVMTLSKFEEENPMPDFRGREKIKDLFEKISKMFSHNDGRYSKTDKQLGNL